MLYKYVDVVYIDTLKFYLVSNIVEFCRDFVELVKYIGYSIIKYQLFKCVFLESK